MRNRRGLKWKALGRLRDAMDGRCMNYERNEIEDMTKLFSFPVNAFKPLRGCIVNVKVVHI